MMHSMVGWRQRGLLFCYTVFLFLVLLPLVSTTRGAAAAATTTTTTATNNEDDCCDSAEALQAAINAIPPNNDKMVDLWLCGDGDDVEVKEPIRIADDRSIRIGCRRRRSTAVSSSNSDYIEEEDVFCTLKSHPDKETRLFEMISSRSSSSRSNNGKSKKTPTVQLNHLRMEDGESYHEPPIPALLGMEDVTTGGGERQQPTGEADGVGLAHEEEGGKSAGGGAILARGYNLVLEDCQLINNVASQKGGALSVHDDEDQPILFLLTRTIFQDNLSIGVDSSAAAAQEEVAADCHSLYFQQSHPGTTVELNTENDFLPQDEHHGEGSSSSSSSSSSSLDYWDDPAQAAQALQSFAPGRAGATLCF